MPNNSGDIEFKIGGDASPLINELKRALDAMKASAASNPISPLGDPAEIKKLEDRIQSLTSSSDKYHNNSRKYSADAVHNIQAQTQAYDRLAASAAKASNVSVKLAKTTSQFFGDFGGAGGANITALQQHAAAVDKAASIEARAYKAVAEARRKSQVFTDNSTATNKSKAAVQDVKNAEAYSRALEQQAIAVDKAASIEVQAYKAVAEARRKSQVFTDNSTATNKSKVAVQDVKNAEAYSRALEHVAAAESRAASAASNSSARASASKIVAQAKATEERTAAINAGADALARYKKFQDAANSKALGQAAVKAAAGIKKETVAADASSKALGRLSKAKHMNAEATRQMTVFDEKAVAQLNKFSRVVAVVQGPLGPVAGRITAMASAIRTMGMGALATGLSIAGLGATLRRAIPAAIDLQRTQSVLAAATMDAGKSLSFVIDESRRTGQAYATLARSYAQLSAAAKGTSLAGKDVDKVFKAVNTAALALRLGPEQTAGALKAMEQMVSKGTVSMEELRQQLGERLPGAFRMASDAMGMTTIEMNKAVASGNILATDLLPKLADEIQNRFGASAEKASANLGVALEKLTNELDVFFGKLLSGGQLNKFSEIVDSLTKSLQRLSDSGVKLAKVFTGVVAVAFGGAAFFALRKMVKMVKGAAEGFGHLLIASKNLKTSFTGVTKVFKGFSFAVGMTPWGRIAKLGLAAADVIGSLIPTVLAATAGWTAYSYAMDGVSDSQAKVLTGAEKDKQWLEQLHALITEKTNKLHALQARLADSQENEAKAIKKAGDNSARAAQAKQFFAGVYKKLNTEIKAVTSSLDDLQASYDKEAEKLKDVIPLTATLSKEMNKFITKTDAALTRQQGTAATRLLDSIQQKIDKQQAIIVKADKALKAGQHTDKENKANQDKKAAAEEAIRVLTDLRVRANKEVLKEEDLTQRGIILTRTKANNKLQELSVARGSIQAVEMKAQHQRALAEQQFVIAGIKAKDADALQALHDNFISQNKLIDKQAKVAADKAKIAADKIKSSRNAANDITLQEIKIFGTRKGSLQRLQAKQELALLRLENQEKAAERGLADGAELEALKKFYENKRALLIKQQTEQTSAFTDNKTNAANRSDLVILQSQQAAAATNRSSATAQNAAALSLGGASAGTQASAALKARAEAEQAAYDNQQEIRMTQYANQYEAAQGNAERQAQLFAEYNAAELAATAEHERAKTQIKLDAEQLRNDNIMGLRQEFSNLVSEGQQVNFGKLLDGIKSFHEQAKDFDKMGTKDRVKLVGKGLDALTGLMDSHNRRAFETGKAAAVAKATIDGISATVSTFREFGGWPLGVIPAGIMAAISAQNVQKIMNTKFKGGATKATTGGGGGGSISSSLSRAQSPGAVPQYGNQQGSQPIQIYVNGVISQDQLVNDIVPQALKRQVANNDFVLIDQRSANGQLLQANGLA